MKGFSNKFSAIKMERFAVVDQSNTMRLCTDMVMLPASKEIYIYIAFYFAWKVGLFNRGKHMWKECRVNSSFKLSPQTSSAGDFGLSQVSHSYINVS